MRPIDADKLMEDVAAARPFFTVEASTSLARACKKYMESYVSSAPTLSPRDLWEQKPRSATAALSVEEAKRYGSAIRRLVDIGRIVEVDGLPELNELERAAVVLEKLFAGDVAEITHCGDCIHENTAQCPLCWIENHTLQFVNHDADFYCGKGERRRDA